MSMPEQIRKQTEAVQELYKQLNNEESATETGTPAANGNSAEGQHAGNTAPAANSVANDASQPAGNEPSPASNGDGEDPNSETYAQRWRTLQGLYNAEVPRLQTQNRELTGRVQQMEQLLSTLSNNQAMARPQVKADPLVTEQDVQEYGESLDVMRKVSREELNPFAAHITNLENQIRSMQSSLTTQVLPQVNAVTQQAQMSAEERFWGTLTQQVPNWQSVNNNPKFQEWLLDTDPLTGLSRQTILEDAQRNHDVFRIANFFTTWLNLTGQTNAGAQPNRSASASELERQVAPGRGRNTGAPSQSGSQTYTPSDIAKFFADVRQGRFKGREAERDRLERDIFAAQRDGRIVANA